MSASKDDMEPIREREDSDDLIILEEIIPEESWDIVAGPSQNEGITPVGSEIILPAPSQNEEISPGESGIIVAASPQNEGHENKKTKTAIYYCLFC